MPKGEKVENDNIYVVINESDDAQIHQSIEEAREDVEAIVEDGADIDSIMVVKGKKMSIKAIITLE